MGDHVELTAMLNESGKPELPKVTDFDNFLPWACRHLSINTKVTVVRTTQTAYVSAAVMGKKSSRSKRQSVKSEIIRSDIVVQHIQDQDSSDTTSTQLSPESAILVETVYNSAENLVKLKFLKNPSIPQKIMKIIGLTIPYQKLLTSITIDKGLNKENLYEISKFLPNSNITELCFDGSFLAEANYHTLLTNSKLKHLSLARCSINDAVVQTITDQLAGQRPASKVLSALNLSSNRITDVGAKYVADMLRTNRQLSYLNLAGNMLTDDGGGSILDTLQKFPLGSQELLESRARYIAYLKKKYEYIEKIIKELQTADEEKNSKRKSSKKQPFRQKLLIEHNMHESDERKLQDKAERLAELNMGLYDDPFSLDNTESQGGIVHCLGNNTLCYLNLAYNNLTYDSVKKLLNVLQMQMSFNRTPRGLIKVVIEGNLLPVACREFEEIDRLLAVISDKKKESKKKS